MNCWEFKKCAEAVYRKCPAYPDNGRLCWKVTGTVCEQGKKAMSTVAQKIAYCRTCAFYNAHALKP